jgi:hypothetical protein
MHYHNDGILIQPLEHPKELPVSQSAEQAVKVPLRLLQGSGGSAKRDKQSSFTKFGNFPKFQQEITRNLCLLPELLQAAAQCALSKFY